VTRKWTGLCGGEREKKTLGTRAYYWKNQKKSHGKWENTSTGAVDEGKGTTGGWTAVLGGRFYQKTDSPD